jgi:hypothetical protein
MTLEVLTFTQTFNTAVYPLLPRLCGGTFNVMNLAVPTLCLSEHSIAFLLPSLALVTARLSTLSFVE